MSMAIATLLMLAPNTSHAEEKWKIVDCTSSYERPLCIVCVHYKRGSLSDKQCSYFRNIQSEGSCDAMLKACLLRKGSWVTRHPGEDGDDYRITPPTDKKIIENPGLESVRGSPFDIPPSDIWQWEQK